MRKTGALGPGTAACQLASPRPLPAGPTSAVTHWSHVLHLQQRPAPPRPPPGPVLPTSIRGARGLPLPASTCPSRPLSPSAPPLHAGVTGAGLC